GMSLRIPRVTRGIRRLIPRLGEARMSRAMNQDNLLSRREMLRRSGMGFASLGLANLLESQGLLTAKPHTANLSPLAPRPPHFPGKAKRVIHLFMNGGPSHVDTFDPKPSLARYAGQ